MLASPTRLQLVRLKVLLHLPASIATPTRTAGPTEAAYTVTRKWRKTEGAKSSSCPRARLARLLRDSYVAQGEHEGVSICGTLTGAGACGRPDGKVVDGLTYA